MRRRCSTVSVRRLFVQQNLEPAPRRGQVDDLYWRSGLRHRAPAEHDCRRGEEAGQHWPRAARCGSTARLKEQAIARERRCRRRQCTKGSFDGFQVRIVEGFGHGSPICVRSAAKPD